jgi:hypothetical protein
MNSGDMKSPSSPQLMQSLPEDPTCPIHCPGRNLPHASLFDDTPPGKDGPMEVGAKPTGELHDVMEGRFQRKSYLPQDALLVLT